MKKGLFTALLAFTMLCAAAASAQSYPSRPIHVIVPFGPGGGNDLYGRTFGQKLRERLGQPVVVEIKTGAGGQIAADYVAKSAPDGYTLLVVQPSFLLSTLLFRSLPYDIMKSFAPIGIAATVPMVLMVTNNLPVTSVNELIAYAKANPGKLSYATTGRGSPHHLSVELIMSMTGTKMVDVPYKGASAMLMDLISGEVQLMFGAINSAIPFFQARRTRAIAVGERQRLPQFKDLPTVSESLPGYETSIWYGLVTTAGTPEAILKKLSEEQRLIGRMPEVRGILAREGLDSNPTSAAEMTQFFTAEIEKWGKAVKSAGIQPQ